MCGVLFCRPRSKIEIINDRNGDVINWWNMVRERPQDVACQVYNSPVSRVDYDLCYERLHSGELDDSLERARAFFVVTQQSMTHGIRGGIAFRYTFAGGEKEPFTDKDIKRLSDRLRKVQVECNDAVSILDRICQLKETMIYCDPPYKKSDTTAYGNYDAKAIDWDDFETVLKKQKGKVAISGYKDEWDCLGWDKHNLKTFVNGRGVQASNHARYENEVLWCNYKAENQERLF